MSKEKKERTIDYLKKGHVVSDEIKVKIKEFAKIKRTILKTLETEHKTIPQIAKETNILNAPNVFNQSGDQINNVGQSNNPGSILRTGELEYLRNRSRANRIRW